MGGALVPTVLWVGGVCGQLLSVSGVGREGLAEDIRCAESSQEEAEACDVAAIQTHALSLPVQSRWAMVPSSGQRSAV